jgi:hypothetical protein
MVRYFVTYLYTRIYPDFDILEKCSTQRRRVHAADETMEESRTFLAWCKETGPAEVRASVMNDGVWTPSMEELWQAELASLRASAKGSDTETQLDPPGTGPSRDAVDTISKVMDALTSNWDEPEPVDDLRVLEENIPAQESPPVEDLALVDALMSEPDILQAVDALTPKPEVPQAALAQETTPPVEDFGLVDALASESEITQAALAQETTSSVEDFGLVDALASESEITQAALAQETTSSVEDFGLVDALASESETTQAALAQETTRPSEDGLVDALASESEITQAALAQETTRPSEDGLVDESEITQAALAQETTPPVEDGIVDASEMPQAELAQAATPPVEDGLVDASMSEPEISLPEVETAHGEVETVHGEVETAHGEVETAHGEVETAQPEMQAVQTEVQAEVQSETHLQGRAMTPTETRKLLVEKFLEDLDDLHVYGTIKKTTLEHYFKELRRAFLGEHETVKHIGRFGDPDWVSELFDHHIRDYKEWSRKIGPQNDKGNGRCGMKKIIESGKRDLIERAYRDRLCQAVAGTLSPARPRKRKHDQR